MLADAEGLLWSDYGTFLRSPLWKRRRDAWLRSNGPWCRACGRTGLLDLHHLEHIEGLLGKEPDSALTALCRRDHFLCHRYFERGRYATIREASAAAIRDVQTHKRKVAVLSPASDMGPV
jgi:hypothetical protein